MAEDAGKKDALRAFLKRVNKGINFIEEIWVEREIRSPGIEEGKFNTASSLSGKSISNVTELLNDDLRYTFQGGNFTFRFIAAAQGSGKTTLIDYLRERITVAPQYREHSIVVQFPLNALLSQPGDENFGVKFYSYVLAQTFWALMSGSNTYISENVKQIGREFLEQIIGNKEIIALKAVLHSKNDSQNTKKINFLTRISEYFCESKANLKLRFFDTTEHFFQKDTGVTFVYLIDELDALRQSHDYLLGPARSVIRDLINEALSQDNIRLMIYMVGRPQDVEAFVKEDEALYSRVPKSIINLVSFRQEECDQIRDKIEERIYGAYCGCKDFNQAWQEIKNIKLEPSQDYKTLREFCQKFSDKVIQVHENYFESFDQPFNQYESEARKKFEVEVLKKWDQYLGNMRTQDTHFPEQNQDYCGHQKWKKYKGKQGYELLIAQTTTLRMGSKNHALDCYAELRHNGHQVAAAYGEAKSYPLIKEHIDTFETWLQEFRYNPCSTNGNPPDLAFLISPVATDLQKRKLEFKHIEFIEMARIEPPPLPPVSTGGSVVPSNNSGININTSDRNTLTNALKGSKFQNKTIDKIIANRPYTSLQDLITKTGFGKSIQQKLQANLNNGDICFE